MIVGVMTVGVLSVGVMSVGVLSVGVMSVGVLSVGVMTLSQKNRKTYLCSVTARPDQSLSNTTINQFTFNITCIITIIIQYDYAVKVE